MSRIPPAKRKQAGNSLRKIARKLGVKYKKPATGVSRQRASRTGSVMTLRRQGYSETA